MRSITQLLDLTGRVALVAGGAGRLGFTAARTLTELGADVALVDIDSSACQVRAAELAGASGRRALAVTCDLADEDDARRCVHRVVDELGGLDVLVHCAALVGTSELTGWIAPFEKQTAGAWEQALRVNLTSAFVLTQEAHPALAHHGRGSVILFSSIYGLVGPQHRMYEGTSMGNPVAYGASKGAIVQLARSLATTLAPDVRVNAVSPGGVAHGQPESFVQRYQERTPLARMAEPEDLKGAVAYLASDLSAYVTGHNLVVDGGWTAW